MQNFYYKNATAANVGTSETTLYTVNSTATATVISLVIANRLQNSIGATVKVVKSGGANALLVANGNIPVGQSLVVVGKGENLILMSDDYVRVTASELNACDVVLSAVEHV